MNALLNDQEIKKKINKIKKNKMKIQTIQILMIQKKNKNLIKQKQISLINYNKWQIVNFIFITNTE